MMYEIHDVANIFPMIVDAEFKELADDIRQHGLHEPIWLHDGKIIDGRNRYKACVEVGVDPEFREWDGDGSLVEFVISLNLHRRHLTSSQRSMVALDILPMLEAEAKERQRAAGGDKRRSDANKAVPEKIPEAVPRREARDAAAQLAGTNPRYVSDAKKIAESAPELAEQVRAGKKTIAKAKKELAKREKVERKEAKRVEARRVTERYKVMVADVREAIKSVDAESVDWIITDPPYPAEYVDLFEPLSEFASHALKPGGSLICMVGQSYLPDYINHLGKHLNYHWSAAYMTPGGQAVQLWKRKVNTFWKPLLWYVKGEYTGDWVGDVCTSKVNDNDKRFHHWGQSESGLADIIERFTDPNDLICDPFCGGGSTGVVAVAMDRQFLGMDIDEQHVKRTAERCEEAQK